jgi:anti-sigma regulatory factor (Ser/Thr protein kinase)
VALIFGNRGSSGFPDTSKVPVPDLELEFSPDHDQSRVLRAKIREWCSAEGYPDPYIDDVLLVASELFSNAVHASVGNASISVGVARHPDGALVRMTNVGPGFDPERVPVPHPDRVGGRGIWLAKTLGTLGVTQRQSKTIVTVVVG